MENNIISRREFFKGAAKKALPIVGAVVLASMPNIANAEVRVPCLCEGSCRAVCASSCTTVCTGCKEACKNGNN